MDYSKTKIYKIWSLKGHLIYVGATTKDLLCQRMSKHRRNYKQWLKGKTNHTASYILFEEYGLENCQIELIEAKECQSKDEQKKLEGHYIRTLECANKNIPDRTRIEYCEANKDKINEKEKQYRETNKDNINEKYKKYYETNKDKINEKDKKYREANKDKINEKYKQYREANKDKINEKYKQYREANKEKINEKQRINRLKRIEAKKQTN